VQKLINIIILMALVFLDGPQDSDSCVGGACGAV